MPPPPPPQSDEEPDESSFRKVMLHLKEKEASGELSQSGGQATGGAQPSSDKSVAEALVLRYENLDKQFAGLHKLLEMPEYSDWADAKGLKEAMADQSVKAEKLLKQIDSKVAQQKDAIAELIGKAETWVASKLLLAQQLAARRVEVLKVLGELEKAAISAVARGTAKDREEMKAEAEPNAAGVAAACKKLMLDDAEQSLARLKNIVGGLDLRVKQAFETFSKKLDTMKGGEVQRVSAQSTLDEKQTLVQAVALVEAALRKGTLDEVSKAFDSLEFDIKSIDGFHVEAVKAKGDYEGIKQRYDAVMKIKAESLAKANDKKNFKALQERLQEGLDEMLPFVEDEDWNNVSGYTDSLSKLLDTAGKVLGDNAQAQEQIRLAEERQREMQKLADEAAKLLEAQLQQQRMQQYELDKAAGISEGNRLFNAHGNDIIQKVWKETRKHVPHAENCSISGFYSLEDIQAAILIWNNMAVNVGLFNSCWVPGGGRIQDKRPKGRQEVQGNFISGWGTRSETVNVHVDLRREDWERLPRA